MMKRKDPIVTRLDDDQLKETLAAATAKETTSDNSEAQSPDHQTETPDYMEPPSRRASTPAYIALALSVIWIGTASYVTFTGREDGLALTPQLMADIALLMAPVTVFWLIALVFQRTDPLLERRLAMAQTMNKALAPVEQAELRLAALNKKLTIEVEAIDEVAKLATDRIQNLEKSFESQVSELFSATAQAEAQAVSIKDSLEREREEIGALGQALADKLTGFENVVSGLHAKILGAGDKTAATAVAVETRLEGGITKLSDTTDELRNQLEEIISAVNQSAKTFEHSVDDSEIRLNTVVETLLSGLGSFKKDVEGLEGRSHEFSEHMQEQGRLLTELASTAADKSEVIEQSLARHVSEVRAAANEALDETEQVASRVAEQAKIMAEGLQTSLADAGTSAVATTDTIKESIQELVEQSRGLLDDVANERKAVQAEAASEIDNLTVSMMNASASAREALNDLTSNFKSESADLVSAANETAERTLAHIRQLRAGIEAELEEVSDATVTAMGRLDASATGLSERAQTVSSDIDLAAERMKQSENAFADTTEDARTRLIVVLDELSMVENAIEAKRDALHSAATDASEVIIAATARFDGEAGRIADKADGATQRIDQAHDKLLDREQSLRDLSGAMSGDLTTVTTQLLQSTHTMRAELSKSREEIKATADDLHEREAALRSTGASLITDLTGASEAISGEAARFRNQTEGAVSDLTGAAEAVRIEAERADEVMKRAVSQTHAELHAGLDGISTEAEQRITVLKEELHSTLQRLLSEYEDNAQRAEKESAHLAMRLGSEAVRIAEVTDKFIAKAKELDDNLKASSSKSFARTSKLLMQSLTEASVDIHRALATNIPDKDWEAFLAGDKSRFMRKTVQIGDRKAKARIAKQFAGDRDFKETVVRFMTGFESLMERSMEGDRGDALSVTIISSDMGKLYVMLAQALNKLN